MEKKLTEEEYLQRHLEGLEKKVTEPVVNKPTTTVFVDNTIAADLQYFAFDVKQFPCGRFYPIGTTIQVRAAKVKEIQLYSMVDDNNFYDIVEKMNDMLASCVRVKYPDNIIGSYLDIRDPDRYFLLFLIRELTFQGGTVLTTEKTCSCNVTNKIQLKRENFVFHTIDEKLERFYNSDLNCYKFNVKNGNTYLMAPPTIGLQKSFTEYIIRENAAKRKPNLSFLKVIPFLLHDKTSISLDEITSKLEDYQNIDDVSFQFLNSAVDKMTFGIKEVVKMCECGLEVRTDMIFPNGPSALFVIHDAFEEFIA